VTVTPSTVATIHSPVGSYPITATISGAAAVNYTITTRDGTLIISKAPLYISAKNVATTYGQNPPPLTGYEFSGFVNGDTTSVVTGAPVLTTTVTATTPVGVYLIGVHTGTLTAQNYYFNDFSNGEGHVYVEPAILTIHPAATPFTSATRSRHSRTPFQVSLTQIHRPPQPPALLYSTQPHLIPQRKAATTSLPPREPCKPRITAFRNTYLITASSPYSPEPFPLSNQYLPASASSKGPATPPRHFSRR
jgi:hypothetical protein